jgi:hypothetical protein
LPYPRCPGSSTHSLRNLLEEPLCGRFIKVYTPSFRSRQSREPPFTEVRSWLLDSRAKTLLPLHWLGGGATVLAEQDEGRRRSKCEFRLLAAPHHKKISLLATRRSAHAFQRLYGCAGAQI